MPITPGATLLGAVTNLMLESAAVSSLIGTNCWSVRQPEGYQVASGPAVVLTNLKETIEEWTSETPYIWRGTISLCCVAQTCQAAEALGLAVQGVMDGPSNGVPAWSVTGGNTIGSLQTEYTVDSIGPLAPSTEYVFEAVLTYLTRRGAQLAA